MQHAAEALHNDAEEFAISMGGEMPAELSTRLRTDRPVKSEPNVTAADPGDLVNQSVYARESSAAPEETQTPHRIERVAHASEEERRAFSVNRPAEDAALEGAEAKEQSQFWKEFGATVKDIVRELDGLSKLRGGLFAGAQTSAKGASIGDISAAISHLRDKLPPPPSPAGTQQGASTSVSIGGGHVLREVAMSAAKENTPAPLNYGDGNPASMIGDARGALNYITGSLSGIEARLVATVNMTMYGNGEALASLGELREVMALVRTVEAGLRDVSTALT